MSTSFRSLSRAAVAVLLAAAAAAPSFAAPADLDRVEISGRRPGEAYRTDVRATCPGAEKVLFDALAPAQFRTMREGVTLVSFRLTGSEISEVRQVGPQEYLLPVRRAMRQLQCRGQGTDELFVMQISFSNRETTPGTSRVALLD